MITLWHSISLPECCRREKTRSEKCSRSLSLPISSKNQASRSNVVRKLLLLTQYSDQVEYDRLDCICPLLLLSWRVCISQLLETRNEVQMGLQWFHLRLEWKCILQRHGRERLADQKLIKLLYASPKRSPCQRQAFENPRVEEERDRAWVFSWSSFLESLAYSPCTDKWYDLVHLLEPKKGCKASRPIRASKPLSLIWRNESLERQEKVWLEVQQTWLDLQVGND